MNAKLEGDFGTIEIKDFESWKRAKNVLQIIGNDFGIFARKPGRFNLQGSPWALAHPMRARHFMQDMGIFSVMDEVLCPRCKMEVIKEKDVPLTSVHASKYAAHLGCERCRLQEQMGKQIGKSDLHKIKRQELTETVLSKYEIPLCKCGCGEKVTFNAVSKRFAKYVTGHNNVQNRYQEKLLAILEGFPDGMLQSELWKELDLGSRDGSRIAQSLEDEGYIKREKVLHEGRNTFKLIKIPEEVIKVP